MCRGTGRDKGPNNAVARHAFHKCPSTRSQPENRDSERQLHKNIADSRFLAANSLPEFTGHAGVICSQP